MGKESKVLKTISDVLFPDKKQLKKKIKSELELLEMKKSLQKSKNELSKLKIATRSESSLGRMMENASKKEEKSMFSGRWLNE